MKGVQYMTQLTTINTDDYATMAKAMGIANEKTTAGSGSLPRLKISHTPIMGEAEVNGKKMNIEVVEGGSYKLEIQDKEPIYATSIKMRPFLQRFMHKRFIQGDAKNPGKYVKSIMADTLDVDLKDNAGGFNCGKPAGYIKDWAALPKDTQDLLKSIKRVRAVFGEVEMINPTNDKGEAVEPITSAFIWEIDNREAFKEIGNSFVQLAKMQRLPIQHIITANTDERTIPTGAKYYVPVASLDVTNTIEITQEDQTLFGDFMAWVDSYNNYIINQWTEKATDKMSDEDVDAVEDIIDLEIDDEMVA
jgi:hypothetical protein